LKMRFQVEHFGKKSQTSSAWKTLAFIVKKTAVIKINNKFDR
jgi:hypothetical protein